MQWNDNMDEAPRDGTAIILRNEKNPCMSPCWFVPSGEISEYDFWAWTQNEPVWFVEVLNPTHWMPLPEPPK